MTFDSHAHRWKRDAGHVCSRLPPSTTGAGRQAELAAPVSGETFSLDIPFHRTFSAQWLSACLRYYQLTGDKDLLLQLFPAAESNIAAFERYMTPHGVTDKVGWGFV